MTGPRVRRFVVIHQLYRERQSQRFANLLLTLEQRDACSHRPLYHVGTPECNLLQNDCRRNRPILSSFSVRHIGRQYNIFSLKVHRKLTQYQVANKKVNRRKASTVKEPIKKTGEEKGEVGNDLLSHAVARILPSALAGLTAGFGMGPGVPPPLLSPTNLLPSLTFTEFRWSLVLG